jgi:hypothetical protein
MRTIILGAVLGISACARKPQLNLPVETSRAGKSGSTADIVKFCRLNKGRMVGNGQCWSLPNEAFKAAGKSRPGSDLRVWGRVVNTAKEPIRSGDIVEFESASFSEGIITGHHHTAVVSADGPFDKFTVAEQNVNGMKVVSFREMSLKTLRSGKVTVYRPL